MLATLCMLCRVMSCHSMQHQATLQHTMPCDTISCNVMSCKFYILTYHDMWCYVSPRRNIPQYAITSYNMPWYNKLHNACHVVQCHATQCNIILCHVTSYPATSCHVNSTLLHTTTCDAMPAHGVIWLNMQCRTLKYNDYYNHHMNNNENKRKITKLKATRRSSALSRA